MLGAQGVVVVAVAFDRSGDEAALAALRLLACGAARVLHLVHVLDPREIVDHREKPALVLEEEVLARAPRALSDRVYALSKLTDLRYGLGRVQAHARIGPVAETLLQVCVDYDADLLIVGTHGRRGLDHVLLGSVSEKVLRSACCPVLVARRKDYEGLEKTPRPDPAPAPGEALESGAGRTFEPVGSTTMAGWQAADSAPTGFRIV